MNIFDELQARSLLHDSSDLEALKALKPGTPFYVGFDPSAPSLQIGNLAILLTALRLARAGFEPIILFGGATGAIGDPRPNSERTLLERETIDLYVQLQIKQVEKIFANFNLSATFVNNFDWTKEMSVLDFLRDTGKYFTVNYMIAKDTVKTRLEGTGISYTEFSYMLLQALDYLHLYQQHNCRLQIGASDQWGNITAGLELIRKKIQGEAHAFTIPLITDSSGKKFGKSEGNALWLDENQTSPYKLHQYFLNLPDADVIRLLKVYSFLELNEITELEKSLTEAPEKRLAQQALADQLCNLLHGQEALETAKKSASVLFGGSLTGLDDSALMDIFAHVPGSEISTALLASTTVLDAFVNSKLVPSKGEAKRLLKNGGVYVNNLRIDNADKPLIELNPEQRKLFILRSGKKSYHLLKIV